MKVGRTPPTRVACEPPGPHGCCRSPRVCRRRSFHQHWVTVARAGCCRDFVPVYPAGRSVVRAFAQGLRTVIAAFLHVAMLEARRIRPGYLPPVRTPGAPHLRFPRLLGDAGDMLALESRQTSDLNRTARASAPSAREAPNCACIPVIHVDPPAWLVGAAGC